MQNYYGYAIRNNKGNLASMKNSIWAIYHHMIQSNDSEKLWSNANSAPKTRTPGANFARTSSIIPPPRRNTTKSLSKVFRGELRTSFVRLSDEKLLSRCLKGIIQSQNVGKVPKELILWKTEGHPCCL